MGLFKVDLKTDALVFQGRGTAAETVLEDFRQITGTITDGRFAGKGQDVREHLFEAADLFDNCVCVAMLTGFIRQAFQKPSRKPADRNDWIFQFMDQICRHLADGRQALPMDQALTGLTQAGVGLLDSVVKHGVFDRHAGLVGKELKQLQVVVLDRHAGLRVIYDDYAK